LLISLSSFEPAMVLQERRAAKSMAALVAGTLTLDDVDEYTPPDLQKSENQAMT
jgi:hypothetical protein